MNGIVPAFGSGRQVCLKSHWKATRFAVPAVCLVAAWLLTLPLAAGASAEDNTYFKIMIVDEQTGRGVPLVELKTVNNVRYYTDSNGIVAFHEPGLMDRRVFFHVKSHGYEFPKDGFGYRGKAIELTPGGSLRLKIKRINIAQRLYRVTGGGIYRDSVLTGHPVPIRRAVLNGLVFGSDSVVNTVYRGKIYWFWGDTNRPSYPLGNFHVPGAVSRLPKDGGPDPEVGVELDYFLGPNGFAKETARMPGDGPTWINGLVTLRDPGGRQRLFAYYVKVRKFLEVYEKGLVEFDPAKQQFDKALQFEMNLPAYPTGHPLKHVAEGVEYVYFGDPFPLVRVRADVEHLLRPASYESFTCLKQGTRLDPLQLDRADDGTLRYAWKQDTPAVMPQEEARLIKAGHLKPEEALLYLRDSRTGKPITVHRGSICWNDYRKRWVMIAVEVGGTSHLGEVWYAEGDTLEGPWTYATKIVTHEKYSFYNPKQHPMFDKSAGRVIFFEGTYVNSFSGNPDATPRYDYNQVMYKLDLADPRLVLPVPIYGRSDEGAASRFDTAGRLREVRFGRPIAFFALDRKGPGTVAVYQRQDDGDGVALEVDAPLQSRSGENPKPLFYALPADTRTPPATTVPLYEFVHQDGGRRTYSSDASWRMPGCRRVERPLCLVWRNPYRGKKGPSSTRQDGGLDSGVRDQ